jgi:outer membrane protein assembly factor BamD
MRRTYAARAVMIGVLALVAGCAQKRELVPAGTAQADQFLFEKGEAALKERKWLNAREYYRQIVDNYPQSTYRPDAKLAVGDTYIGDNTTESLLLAINEFREFLTFYPTHARADYAQYRLSVAHTEQMLRPERDQSATREAVKELNVFVERYPNSALMPEAKKLLRDAKDRLSEASYRVGFYYFRVKWWAGAIDRFREVLTSDPEYTGRDAVYFHFGESLIRWAEQIQVQAPDEAAAKNAEALPYFERVLKEFEQSEYLERSKKRIAELKAGQTPTGTETKKGQ